MPIQRVTTGIPGLDRLIEGGFVKGSIIMLAGQTGTGKTIFGCQYLLDGLRRGENGVYLTLEESEEDILGDVARFGWTKELRKYITAGKLIMHSKLPTDIKELEETSLTLIRKVDAQRFVLDSLSIATMGWKVSTMEVGKVRSQIFDYFKLLKRTGVTSLLIVEIPERELKAISRFGFEEFLADGLIIVYYLEYATGGVPRSLLIRKMRRTKHSADIYPMEITDRGIKIYTS
jgi:KaiC/GvpD/RAD55 family RecA-like ATPase